MTFDAPLQALTDAGVDFIIIGGLAATLHGSAYLTNDLDIFISRDPENLKRIVKALAPFHPRLRDFPTELPFVWDAATLRNGTIFTLATDIGIIDLLAEETGIGSFQEVKATAVSFEAFERRILALDLKSLIESKRAAGRDKDLSSVKELEVLLEAERAASKPNDPVFLLGAGFNCEAHAHGKDVPNKCHYPLAPELARTCFDRDLRANEAVEEMFAEALANGRLEPLTRLCDCLMRADYYISRSLCGTAGNPANPYQLFFERFKSSLFLTFNYDSLAEAFLHRHDRWYPDDGYGVTVHASKTHRQSNPTSSSLVLHLHGSLCVYTRKSETQRRPDSAIGWVVPTEARYFFDPDSIGGLWPSYSRADMGRVPIEERIIASVPDKAEELKRDFVRAVYDRASEILSKCERLVSIGYSFNQHDAISYDPLMQALSRNPRAQIVVVAPEAASTVRRLSAKYPLIRWTPIAKTFGDWAVAEFTLPIF